MEPLTDNGVSEGNTEPSFHGNVVEGVTTRGRAYRRWEGACSWCGAFLSKRLSDIRPSGRVFCNKHCMGKYIAAHREYRRWENPPVMAVISSTNAAPEREDIV